MQFHWTNMIYSKGKTYIHIVSPRTGRAYTVRCGPNASTEIKRREFRDSHVKVGP